MLRDASRLAIGTLTAIPVPPPRGVTRPVAGLAMLLAPLAVLPAGALLGALLWGGAAVDAAPLLTAALGVAAVTLTTRAMHLDGLADTADGLSSSYDRDRALAVMRSGDVGPSGVAAVVLVLAVDVAALGDLAAKDGGPVLALLAFCASRLALTVACTRGIPAARPEGLGAMVAGSVPRAAGAGGIGCLALVAAGVAVPAGMPWWAGPAVVIAPVLGAGVVLRRSVTRLGGMTGDVLGAAVEVGFAAALTVAAVLG